MKNAKKDMAVTENPNDVFVNANGSTHAVLPAVEQTETNENTGLEPIDNSNMVQNLGLADAFDAFESNELQSENLNSEYLNLDNEQGVEKVFVHIEMSTIADTINGTDDRIPCVVLLDKAGNRFISADKQLVSKLSTSILPSLVKISYKGMVKSKTNTAYKYRDFDVRRAIIKG